MELEIGKRYRITSPEEPSLKDGEYIIAYAEDELFGVLGGQGLRGSYLIRYCTFTRLPSFGDEVEILTDGIPCESGLWHYYLGENDTRYFLAWAHRKCFDDANYTEAYEKKQFQLRLKSQKRTITFDDGKTIEISEESYENLKKHFNPGTEA